MHKTKTARLKGLFVFVLLLFVATVVLYTQRGMDGLTLSMAAITIFNLLWLMRRPRPTRELPNAAVSCCHYLGDDHKNRPQR